MMSALAVAPNKDKGDWKSRWIARLGPLTATVVRVGKVLAPYLLPFVLVYLLGVPPALAKRAGKKKGRAGSAALDAAATATATAAAATATSVVKKKNILRKILEGVNADGGAIIKGAGDTRGDFAAILNAFSSVFILSGLFLFATLIHKQREMKMDRALARELDKVKEYKENMYFEAVQGLLEKLADPKLKGSVKANLQKQLKDLDPDGVIRKFLEEKGERPDISYLTDRKKKKPKSSDKFSAIAERGAKQQGKGKKSLGGGSKSASKDSKASKDEDEDEDLGEEDEGEDAEEEKAVPPPAPVRAPIRAPSPAPARADDDDDVPEQYLVVLNELFDSLDGAMPPKTRKALIELLKSKIDAVSDPAKRDAVVGKIAERLGSVDYWVSYAEKSGL